jgi:Domain of unknown function (DUF2427)
MSRHTCRLVLPLFLALTTVRGHKHHDELSDEAAAAPIDSILWIHIFLQATVWGILFPIGMVFGLSRSRWHVPLQVRLAPFLAALPPSFIRRPTSSDGPCPETLFLSSRPQASCLRLVATSLGMRMAAGNSSRVRMGCLPTSSSCRLLRSSL